METHTEQFGNFLLGYRYSTSNACYILYIAYNWGQRHWQYNWADATFSSFGRDLSTARFQTVEEVDYAFYTVAEKIQEYLDNCQKWRESSTQQAFL